MITSTDLGFMNVALEQAKIDKSKGDLPFGAVVVYAEKVVGQGHAA